MRLHFSDGAWPSSDKQTPAAEHLTLSLQCACTLNVLFPIVSTHPTHRQQSSGMAYIKQKKKETTTREIHLQYRANRSHVADLVRKLLQKMSYLRC